MTAQVPFLQKKPVLMVFLEMHVEILCTYIHLYIYMYILRLFLEFLSEPFYSLSTKAWVSRLDATSG